MKTMTEATAGTDGSACAIGGGGGGGKGWIEASPAQVREWMGRGEVVVIDVREPDEHARERIAGARLVPLSKFDLDKVAMAGRAGQSVVLHCKGGKRSLDACRLAAPLVSRGVKVVNMTGGIEAWKQAALPVETDTKVSGISVMRQVQLVIGVLLLVSAGLTWWVHPGFVGIAAFLGAGLAFAGASGTCALATLMAAMPWNRNSVAPRAKSSCESGSCGCS